VHLPTILVGDQLAAQFLL